MEFEFEGTVSREALEDAQKGRIARYLVCGTEVYVSEESAKQEERSYDRDKPLHIKDAAGLAFTMKATYYFSSRFFRVIDLLNADDYKPASNIREVMDCLPSSLERVSLLHESQIEFEDGDTAFVLTPLTKEEFEGLTELFALRIEKVYEL